MKTTIMLLSIAMELIIFFYKGTKVEVWKDVFDGTIRIFKNKKIYNTRKIEGHRQEPGKKEQKIIDNQKTLERLFRERDERLKARKQEKK